MTNEELREKSGKWNTNSKLANFLYLLMRDELSCGTVEKLVRQAEKGENHVIQFTNGYLGQYASLLNKRLKEIK